MRISVSVDGLSERSYERIVTRESVVATVSFGEFRLSPGGAETRFDSSSSGSTYQHTGSLDYYRHPDGPRFDPSWVRQARPGGQYSNSGDLLGYAYVIPGARYVTGPSVGVVLPATNATRSSLRFEGWRPEWTYLYGPHMVLNYALENLFAKEQVLNPAGETIDVNGSLSRVFDQVGKQNYTYTGTLTLKLVRTE